MRWLCALALCLASAAGAQSPRQIAVPVAAVWGASVYAIHAEGQWHHEYIGAALLAVPNKRVQWLGLAIMLDDAVQHLIQTRRPAYRSPLNRLYGWSVSL